MRIGRDGTVTREPAGGACGLAAARERRARAAAAQRLPGGDEERGRRDRATALRRPPPAAPAREAGAGEAAVHRARARGERTRQRGRDGRSRSNRAPGRDAGEALHDTPRALRGVVRGALPGTRPRLRDRRAAARAPGRAPWPSTSSPAPASFGPGEPALLPRRHGGLVHGFLTGARLGAAARCGRRPDADRVGAACRGPRRRCLGLASFETNRFYQPGLLDAPDPWLWDAVATGATRTERLRARRRRPRLAASRTARHLPPGRLRIGQRRRSPPERRAERRERRRGTLRGQEALPRQLRRADVAAARGPEHARAHERRGHGRLLGRVPGSLHAQLSAAARARERRQLRRELQAGRNGDASRARAGSSPCST